MKELVIAGVRCFREEQRIPIRPVTLLVGENSTGKSTVLAMLRAAWDVAFRGSEPNFNEEPFDLGGYDAIAHYHGGQGKRVQEFSLEVRTEPTQRAREGQRVKATFTERAGQPILAAWEVQLSDRMIRVNWAGDKVTARASRGPQVILNDEAIDIQQSNPHLPSDAFLAVRRLLFEVDARSTHSAGRRIAPPDMSLLELLPGARPIARPRPLATAPIRSKPERTYDPKRGLREPEGSHVPMELATLQATGPEEFNALAEQIAKYASEAALFSELAVKRLGKKAGDPFQVTVKVGKFAFNLRDVGYGVSQILPILVDALRAPTGQTFLLQQPEVHLHPRAQAALGSLLVQQAANRRQKYVVETHSDHLVDRVRMSIRESRGRRDALQASDVAILYFERKAGRARIHHIKIDEHGNLLNPPDGYREFFLEEERRFLGV